MSENTETALNNIISGTQPQATVIIPHLNQPEYLDICLSSLDRQSLDRSCFEIVVVDNGSLVMPYEVVARHPGTRLLSELAPGPGCARNAGVKQASGHIIAFIDADCRAHRDWLSAALREINRVPRNTVLGGDVQIWHENGRAWTAIEAYESVFAYQFKRYIERQSFSGTGNLVMRHEDFERVGPFGGIEIAEDMDWGRRASDAGIKLKYVPEMIVYHPARRSLRDLCQKWERHLNHYFNMAQGKPLWRLRWILRAGAILVSPLADMFRGFTSTRLKGSSARLKAILVLIVVRAFRAWTMVKLLMLRRDIVWNRG